MRCKLLQIRFTGKTTEYSKDLRHIAIEKDILSELNRCIFQISLKYIKLVIPKILLMLVLDSFIFYFKITWPLPHHTKIKISDPRPHTYTPAKSFLRFLTPPSWRGCMPCLSTLKFSIALKFSFRVDIFFNTHAIFFNS